MRCMRGARGEACGFAKTGRGSPDPAPCLVGWCRGPTAPIAPSASRPASSPTMSARRPSSPGSIRRRCSPRPSIVPASAGLRWGLSYRSIAPAKPSMRRWLGLFGSHAVFHDGLGCVLLAWIRKRPICSGATSRAEDAEDAAAAGGDCGSGPGRTGRSSVEGRARSRLRGTGRRRRFAGPRRSSWCATATSSPSAMPTASASIRRCSASP